MVRATNWLGDAVMSLPAIRTLRQVFPHAQVVLVARPWVADLYARESSIDRIILYPDVKGLRAKREFAARLREERVGAPILLQTAFDAALIAWLAGIPERIGYNRDARGLLLTRAIPVPEPGDLPRHQRFYYLLLLLRASPAPPPPTPPPPKAPGPPAAAAPNISPRSVFPRRPSASAPEPLTATPNAGSPSASPRSSGHSLRLPSCSSGPHRNASSA